MISRASFFQSKEVVHVPIFMNWEKLLYTVVSLVVRGRSSVAALFSILEHLKNTS